MECRNVKVKARRQLSVLRSSLPDLEGPRRLIRDLVATRHSARGAVPQTVLAEVDVDLSLAEATEFLAVTLFGGHLALHTAILLRRSGHGRTLARV